MLGLETNADYLAEQAGDVWFVVLAIGIVSNAAAVVGSDLILVDHPFQGGAVAQAVCEGFGGDASKG